MGKKTVFTNITPLPAQVSREVAVAMLHNHAEMVELNPLVIEHHPIRTPRDAAKDEFLDCAWYEMTDKVPIVPGLPKKKVTHQGCFHDLPLGLQTHVYAPAGLDIRERWSICGSLPGEPDEPRELGVNTPRKGLYLREDGEIKVSILLLGVVRRNLDAAHKVLVERIIAKAERIQAHVDRSKTLTPQNSKTPSMIGFQRGSHMAESNIVRQFSGDQLATPRPILQNGTSSDSAAVRSIRSPLRDDVMQELPASTPRDLAKPLPERPYIDEAELQGVHPALRQHYIEHRASNHSSLPVYDTLDHQQSHSYHNDVTEKHAGKTFAAELEGSNPAPTSKSPDSLYPPEKYDFAPGSSNQKTGTWRPETTYGPVSEISDDSIPKKHASGVYSRDRNQLQQDENSRHDFQSRSNKAVDRFSVVSGISDQSTPKIGQTRFGNGTDKSFSIVSDLSEEPTPRFKQDTFVFAQEQARQAEPRHRGNYT